MHYHLRRATPADDNWQLAIYASSRADEMALTGWSPEQCRHFIEQQHRAQQQHYLQHFPQSVCQLILVGNTGDEVGGRIWLDERAYGLHILDITLLPAWRGQGLGTRCLRALADAEHCLSIQVELHNPARRLYERLGFVAEGTPQGLHQAMRRSAVRQLQTEECLP